MTALLFPVFKSFLRASLVSFLLLLFYIFFGVFYDFLKQLLGNSFLTSYTFILSCFLVFTSLFAYILIKTKKIAAPIARYLNVLFLILVLLDLGNLLIKVSRSQPPAVADLSTTAKKNTTTEKPDIYLILLDEYAGATQLKNVFSFDNSVFLNQLRERGFSVQENSNSNYNSTHYSMASLLNMDYIHNLNTTHVEIRRDIFNCKKLIRNNNFMRFLTGKGYEICNYSYFAVPHKSAKFFYSNFFPNEESIFNNQTLLTHSYLHIGHHFPWLKNVTATDDPKIIKFNNSKIDSLTRTIAREKNKSPRVIYSHFLMPHGPYFFDSTGAEINHQVNKTSSQTNTYIQYLIYTNKKLLSLIDHIMTSNSKQPVIVLMSDHGLRGLGERQNLAHNFSTLNAVYFPSRNYQLFYDGITNVNQFRVILNSLFQQNFPMLQDSTSFITQQRAN